MFGIGFSEVIVVLLVCIAAVDKYEASSFIHAIKTVCSHIAKIKIKIREILKDSDIEDVMNTDYETHKEVYIPGNDGKLYPAHKIDNLHNK